MPSLEELILQRLTEATRAGMPYVQGQQQPQGGGAIPQPQTVSDTMGRTMAAPPSTVSDMAAQNISPEDYNYYVEIQRRNVQNQEGQDIGWDKNVRRWAEMRKKKTPSIEDLSSGGMSREDKQRARDATGRFVTEKSRKLQNPNPTLFDDEEIY